ncbi:MAG: hypothetical protein IJS94_07820, partial [Clostridia bacterium]|nr:hypothetical protein [Clostridia bacterium]
NDTRLAKYFKKYDMNSFYIKVKSEKKGLTATREYASQNGAVYSSLEDENSKIIYLSIKNVTFSLDPAEKTYTVHLLYPLSLEYVYDGCIGAGETVFEGKKCIYEAFYDNYTGGIICHLFDQSGNWIAYEEYEGDEIIQTNYVKTVSGNIPSHVFFEIPSGYRYYYEDTVVTFPSGWFD